MDLKITSEKIANPLLVELLRKLTDSFNRMNREFYVIGATACDIIIRQLIGTTSGRISVPPLEEYRYHLWKKDKGFGYCDCNTRLECLR